MLFDDDDEPIKFFDGEYRFLSNFYPSPVGVYPTVEHGYQAHKTLDLDKRLEIATAPTPGIAKRLGQKVELREDWEDIKIDVMRKFLIAKFQIPELRQKLLETGNRTLIEGNSWNDRFWGVCNGTGLNNLGILLMKIREETR